MSNIPRSSICLTVRTRPCTASTTAFCAPNLPGPSWPNSFQHRQLLQSARFSARYLSIKVGLADRSYPSRCAKQRHLDGAVADMELRRASYSLVQATSWIERQLHPVNMQIACLCSRSSPLSSSAKTVDKSASDRHCASPNSETLELHARNFNDTRATPATPT
jgi:hypothetical protein